MAFQSPFVLPLMPLLAVASLAGPAAWAADAPPQRVALVIGNAAYREAPRLANAAHDADDVCAALRRLHFETLCHTDLRDRAEMMARVLEFARRLGPGSQAVLYYAGHAVQLRNENYLLPTQVPTQRSAELAGASVRLDEILGVLKDSHSAFNLVVLDACRDDPFDAAALHAAQASSADGTLAAARGVPAAASAGPARAGRTRPAAAGAGEGPTFGLGVIRDAPAGSIVLYATGSGEPAYDGRGRNGPLTKHFLAHLEAPGLPVEEFIKRVTAGVQIETLRTLGRRQTPYVYSSFTGEFCFAGCREVPLEAEIESLRRTTQELERHLQRSREQRPAAPRIPPAL